MKKSLFAIAAAAAVLAGCQMEEGAFKADKSVRSIKATIANEDTRTALAQDGEVWHVNWEVGDQILLKAEGKSDTYYTEFGGTNQSEFWWTKGDKIEFDGVTEVVAYSPASLYSSTSDLTYLPSFQGYKAGSTSFTPMMATSTDENFAFKNLCGALKLNITTTAADIVVSSISVKADQGLSGIFDVVDGAAVVDGTEGVTLTSSEGVAINGTAVPFFITVPAGTYTGMEITVTTTDGKTSTVKMKSGASFTVERSKIYEADFAFNDFTASALTAGGICTLGLGSEVNITLKSLTDPSATFATDTKIYQPTKIVLSTNNLSTVGLEVGDMGSDQPAFASFDPATGVMTITTPADEFQLNYDASQMFYGFRGVTEIVGLEKLKSDYCEDMHHLFAYCSSMTKIDLASFNTENVFAMNNMFWYCQAATEINVSSFNTENVANMHSMFCHCDAMEHFNLTNFDTAGVTDFGYMFGYCYALLDVDISSFDTSGGTTFAYMFAYCKAMLELDLATLDTSSSTTLTHMFDNMSNIGVLKLGKNFNVNHAPTMSYMFIHCPMLHDLWFAEGFKPDNGTKPSNFFAYTGTDDFDSNGNCIRTASAMGALTIHCNQDQADWLATTGLRWFPTGYKTENGYWPIPVTFLDYTTGQELSVTWSPN